MNHDATSPDSSRWVGRVIVSHLVVVNDRPGGAVPDLDPEPIHPPTTGELPIDGGQHEAVVAGPIDRPEALILGLRSGNHQPVVGCAVEVEVRDPELELGLAGGDVCSLLVLGNETEGGFPDKGGSRSECPCRRIDPATARYEAPVWIVDDDVLEHGDARGARRVCHSERED